MSYKQGLARLTIKHTSLADQGRYSVVASNDAGQDKSSCFVNIHSKYEISTSHLHNLSGLSSYYSIIIEVHQLDTVIRIPRQSYRFVTYLIVFAEPSKCPGSMVTQVIYRLNAILVLEKIKSASSSSSVTKISQFSVSSQYPQTQRSYKTSYKYANVSLY